MRTPTKEEVKAMVQEVIDEFHPVTMTHAIESAIWYTFDTINKEKPVDLKTITGSGKELFDGIRS